jgi:cytochrome c
LSLVRKAFIFCALALVVSLALARVHPFGDAGLYSANLQPPILNNSQVPPPVPPAVRAILVEKCADCHSNQANAPFYGHFAPVSWLMEHDIVEARKAMNLSLWDTYSADQKQILAAKIVQETKSHDMPLLQYRMIHWNTRIADADLNVLSQWAHGPQSIQDGAVSAGAGDPTRGKMLFEKRCTGCHSLTKNSEGPNLQGVYGHTSGTVEGYAYSSALKNARMVWDESSLDKWLTDPDAFIPGNNMDFLVSNPKDRQDLISYLRQTSGK